MDTDRVENFARCHDGSIKCQFVCTFVECQKKISCIYKEYGRSASKKIEKPKEGENFRRPAWYFTNVKTHLSQHFKGRPEANLPNISSSVEVDFVNNSEVGSDYEIITTNESIVYEPSFHDKTPAKNEEMQNKVMEENTAAPMASAETNSAMSNVHSGIRKEAGSLVKRMVEKFTKDDGNNNSVCSLACSILGD